MRKTIYMHKEQKLTHVKESLYNANENIKQNKFRPSISGD